MMNPNDALKQAKEALQKAIDQKKLNQEFMNSLGPAVVELLKPTLEEMVANSKISREELLQAVAGINITVPKTEVPEANVKVEIPEIKVPQPIVNVTVPEIKIPEPKEIKIPIIKVPKPEVTVNFDASRIKIPEIKMPDEMDVRGWIGFQGYDKGLLRNPLPVQIRDAEGNPVSFGGGSAVIGGGGGKSDFFTLKDIRASSISIIDQDVGAMRVVGNLTASLSGSTMVTLTNFDGLAYNSDNPLPITGNISTSPAPQVSGYADSVNVIQSITLDVKQLSGSIDSVYVTGVAASVYAEIMNPDGRVKVELPTGSSGLTDTELRATSVPVSQVSGATFSVNVVGAINTSVALTNSDGATIDPRDRNWTITETVPVSVASTLGVNQVSGANWSVVATATDLDIRDLTNASDSVAAYQVSGHSYSVFASLDTTVALYNGDNRLRVSVETGGSGLTDAELRATSLPVEQVSGSNWSVNVLSTVGLTDTQLRASSIDVKQVSGSSDSVFVLNTDLDIRDLANATDSVSVYQVSGHIWSVYAQDALTTSSATTLVNADNRLRVSLETGGSGLTDSELRATSLPVEQVSGSNWSVYVTGIQTSLQATIIDSTGVGYSGSNPFPVSIVSGAGSSTVVSGTVSDGTTDDGSNPIKVGGIARTTNPTSHSDGAVSAMSLDSLGRQLTRPVQVRGLMATAYASVANGTETTLLAAGGAGVFHDLVFIQLSNNSTVAVGVDVRSVTAGNVEQHYEIPANAVVGGALPVPWPQGSANNNWTIDLPDVTGTTVTVSALFAKEI